MAKKYHLIASDRTNYGFLKEEEIDVNEEFSTLEQVDLYTCAYKNKIDFINTKIPKSGKNHVSIKYKYNQEDHYLPPLFDCPEMQLVIRDIKEQQVYEKGHTYNYKIISHDNPVFKRTYDQFIMLLGVEPQFFFAEVFNTGPTRNLENYVYNYYQGKNQVFDNLDDERAWRALEEKIKLEFSNYKVFRSYVLCINKYKQDHPGFLERDEEMIDTKPTSTTIIDDSYLTSYDSEEFLTEEEYEQATPEGDDWYNAPRRY